MKKLNKTAIGMALAIALPMLAGTASAQDYQETGETGDPESWETDEFDADWGLYAIGAQYAYARGLTGSGINLGVLDTGTLITHPEFADSGRLHPVRVTITVPDSSPVITDGGIARLAFGDHGVGGVMR